MATAEVPARTKTHWSAVTPPGPPLAPLEGHAEADVAIIGAGFTGLSTALHLLARGKSIAVLEAVEPGYGASGRNNGQVIPTLSRMDPDDLVAKHGAAGDRFADLVRDSASILFMPKGLIGEASALDLVRRYFGGAWRGDGKTGRIGWK